MSELKPIGLLGTTAVYWVPDLPEPVPLDTARPIVEQAMADLGLSTSEPMNAAAGPAPIEHDTDPTQ